MAEIFVSYSHLDSHLVEELVKQLEQSGHVVLVDVNFLALGDSITREIRDKIHSADFVSVFLSPRSVNSTWVAQEILETLSIELEKKRTKLVPCLIAKCDFPEHLTRLAIQDRLYADFVEEPAEAARRLMGLNEESQRPIFKDEHSLLLKVAFPDLEIYLTGETWGWQKHPQLKYHEMLDSYLLFGFVPAPGTYFKHFALCDEGDAVEIRGQLTNARCIVTGVGDLEPGTGKRRIWFCVPNHPIDGADINNRWPV